MLLNMSVLLKKLLNVTLYPSWKLISGTSAESSVFLPTSRKKLFAKIFPCGFPPALCILIASASIRSNLLLDIMNPVGPIVLLTVEPADASARLKPLYNVLN